MRLTNTFPAVVLLFIALQGKALAACWVPMESPSTLGFSVKQPGNTTITGQFRRFDGRICLDPAAPDSGHIRLHVQTASVDTGLPELDQALRSPVFFGTEKWPQATFESESIQHLDGQARYEVKGKLTLRDVSKTIEVPFTLTPSIDKQTAKLEGETAINRLDYGVGQGQWGDTQWADNKVTLEFSVNLERADSNEGN